MIYHWEETCKAKARSGILRREKARNNCTRQLHRIVLLKCTQLAVHCYSCHYLVLHITSLLIFIYKNIFIFI